jgi:VWFA-related protein
MVVKQFLKLIGLSCLLALSAWAQDDAAQQKQRPRRVEATAKPDGPQEVGEDEIVRVNTQLVSVPTAVTDRNGRAMIGLKRENFVIYEDGKPQQVANFATADAPFEVALLLDTSGSTRADINLIRDAAKAFINSLRPGDRVALLAFNADSWSDQKESYIEVLQPLTDDRALLAKKLDKLTSGQGTPLYDALLRVVEEVFRDPPAQNMAGRRAFVALTDGVDSSSQSEFKTARAVFARSGVASYFVQLDTEDFVEERLARDCQDNSSLRLSVAQMQRFRKVFAARADASDYQDFCKMGPFERMEISRALYKIARQEMIDLAHISGGRVFPVQGLSEAQDAFALVAADIGTQYSLGYYSSNKARDGKFRAIRVEVKGSPGAQVRAREGYVAPAN